MGEREREGKEDGDFLSRPEKLNREAHALELGEPRGAPVGGENTHFLTLSTAHPWGGSVR